MELITIQQHCAVVTDVACPVMTGVDIYHSTRMPA